VINDTASRLDDFRVDTTDLIAELRPMLLPQLLCESSANLGNLERVG
jgi:hypothetical protein